MVVVRMILMKCDDNNGVVLAGMMMRMMSVMTVLTLGKTMVMFVLFCQRARWNIKELQTYLGRSLAFVCQGTSCSWCWWRLWWGCRSARWWRSWSHEGEVMLVDMVLTMIMMVMEMSKMKEPLKPGGGSDPDWHASDGAQAGRGVDTDGDDDVDKPKWSC